MSVGAEVNYIVALHKAKATNNHTTVTGLMYALPIILEGASDMFVTMLTSMKGLSEAFEAAVPRYREDQSFAFVAAGMDTLQAHKATAARENNAVHTLLH
jgi:hypothetical protein